MTVSEAQQRIDSREFGEWMAYHAIEPFGEYGAYLRAGIISATVANAAPYRKSGRGFDVKDFMPNTSASESSPRRMSQMEIDARMGAWIQYYEQFQKQAGS